MRKKILLLYAALRNFFLQASVILIDENSNWVIRDICKNVKFTINDSYTGLVDLSLIHLVLRKKLVHFSSVNTLLRNKGIRLLHKSNKVILTWFHFISNDARIQFIPELNNSVYFVHTSCKITKKNLVKYGFSEEKVIIIPIGFDASAFVSYSSDNRKKIKEKLGLPMDKKIIGSFQKDGVGWGVGLKPKLEKGPDIFCDVVERVAQNLPVHVLLTGPARGYVKNRLEKAGISYTHHYFSNYLDIVDYFNALDAYLISSRVEGGPRALHESWASRVPLITTPVGMCADWVKHDYNGFVADIEDVEGLAKQVLRVLNGQVDNLDAILDNAQKDVQQFDWSVVVPQYLKELYLPLLK